MAYDLVTPTSPTPSRRRVGPLLVAVALAVVVAGVAVAAYVITRDRTDQPSGTVGDAIPTITVTGSLRLEKDFKPIYTVGQPCLVTKAGYDDIHIGTQVTITNPAGDVVALGQLGDGRVASDPILTVDGTKGGDCSFPFLVDGVPTGLSSYGIEVAHRGVVRFHEADLVGKVVELTLG